jgi:hypothetical protein
MGNGFFGREDSVFDKTSGVLPNIQGIFGLEGEAVMDAREVFKETAVHRIINTTGDKGDVLCIRKGNSRIPFLKLYGKKELYANGLERNYKPLVDMDAVGESLAVVLSALAGTGNLTEVRYKSIIVSYTPFISDHKSYEELVNKVSDADEW